MNEVALRATVCETRNFTWAVAQTLLLTDWQKRDIIILKVRCITGVE